MKKIEAIIRHFRLEEVAAALVQLGVPGMTVADVRGNVHRRSADNLANGSAEFLPKVVLEVIVPVEQVRPVVDTIQRVARTGQTGDGKIMVSDLIEVIRVRTGEKLDSTLAVSA
ncbi:MAG: P-II family nitrogen regulator [Planctomycetia bacterium]|nr:P-II family nitrogen regulator [Planctomycetia bacterium]